MNLSQLADRELLDKTKQLVSQERKMTVEVLWHLKAVESRRLFAVCGYCSLFEYAVKELHYSDAAAARRISSMRLLKVVPEIAESMEQGALSLSVVGAVHRFVNREEKDQGKVYSKKDKQELLESMKNKSARECEKILLAKSPASAIPAEKQKPVSPTQTELRMVISDETLKNLERVRELLSHQNPEGSNGKLLELLLKMALEKLDPLQKEARAQKREMRKEHKRMQESEPSQKTQPQPTPTSPSEQSCTPNKIPLKREPISAHLRRQVLKRDQVRCTYIDPRSKRRCEARHLLQIDHRVPVALGGKSEFSNLRILCRPHNLSEAARVLGQATMAPYLPFDV